MSKLAWLTPDDLPGDPICRQVWIPNSIEAEAAFRGAFLLLTDAENWEGVGTQTPDDIAALFQAAFFLTQDGFANCEGGKLIGEIFAYAGSTLPAGCLACDGTIYNTADYPALFQVIGSAFGGNGSSTFGVPDLRGRVSLGVGQQPGGTVYNKADSGGEEAHVLTIPELPVHHHTVKRQATVGATPALTNAVSATMTDFPTSDVGADEPHENRQPYLVLPFFIQAE